MDLNQTKEDYQRLQKEWCQNNERVIQGKNHKYKINKNQFLGRGGFGIVFKGISLSVQKVTINNQPAEKIHYRQVAIKEFKRSQKWKHEEDQDKEVILLSKYGKMFDPAHVLQVIDIFQEKETQRYFMVTPLAQGGNLSEKMKNLKDQQNIYIFAVRLAKILKYIHYEALANFRSKERGEEQKQKIAIIHRDVKPQNIVFMNKDGKDMSSIYLLDFGIAKIGYSELLKGYNNCGTSYYKAPEIGEGRIYNAKVDVYGFGCTLFEIINEGERLILTSAISNKYGDRERYIKSRLVDLHQKLLKTQKLKNPYYWIQLLHNCLAYDVKKRYSSQQLVDYVSNNHFCLVADERKLFYGQIAQKQLENKAKRQIFEINFETFRLNMIQDLIFTIFQFIYFEQSRINKFLLYVIIKFIVLFFHDRYQRVKDKCKLYQKLQKYAQLRNMIEQRKINDLNEKSHGKILKEIEKQENSNRIQNKKSSGPISDMIKRYPQILHKTVVEPKRVLFQFCYKKKNDILENQKFARYVLMIISYMEDIDGYEELKVENADLQNFDIQVLSLKRLSVFKKSNEEKLSKEGLKTKLQACKVEATLKSDINRQENKTDLEIERKV